MPIDLVATPPALQEIFKDWSDREVALSIMGLVVDMGWWYTGHRRLRDLASLMTYEHEWRAGRKRDAKGREPVDVDEMVNKWADILIALSTAHQPEDRTRADEQSDEILLPLLGAPSAQIKDFTVKLAKRLEDDPRCPFLVWSAFQRLVAPVILNSPAGEIVALKTTLATEIAELVENDLNRAELIAAIAGALQWRTEGALQKVRDNLKAGGKPRLRGRESCLFLEVPVEGKETAMVVL